MSVFDLPKPSELGDAVRRLIPAAQAEMNHLLPTHTTEIRLTVPEVRSEGEISDENLRRGGQDALRHLVLPMISQMQAEAVRGFGLQPLIDDAREEGMTIVDDHKAWLEEQIAEYAREAEEMREVGLDGQARANLLGRKHALDAALSRLNHASGHKP